MTQAIPSLDIAQLPEPPVRADANLRDFKWMPLNVQSLLESDLWSLATGDEAKAAVTLWAKSWWQIPAGSLPNDDQLLADLSRAGPRWRRVKDRALHGWKLHADGRLYHGTITEKVLEALPKADDFKQRRSADAERKQRERQDRAQLFAFLAARGRTPHWSTKTSELRQLVEEITKADAHVSGLDPNGRAPPVTGSVTLRSRDMSRHGQGPGQGPGPGPGQGPTLFIEEPSVPSGADAPATGKTRKEPGPKATKRCPEAFVVTRELVRWALGGVDERGEAIAPRCPNLTVEGLKRETEKFRNHTFSRAITDWSATWRNWVMNASDRSSPASTRTQVVESSNKSVAKRVLERRQGQQGEILDAQS